MSLTSKRRTTEKTLARSRRNGGKSRGPVTPGGKAHSAKANLRHGFHSDGATPPDDVREIFPLLRAYGEAAAKAPGPVIENGDTGPTPSTAERQQREEARQKLHAALWEVNLRYGRQDERLMGQL